MRKQKLNKYQKEVFETFVSQVVEHFETGKWDLDAEAQIEYLKEDLLEGLSLGTLLAKALAERGIGIIYKMNKGETNEVVFRKINHEDRETGKSSRVEGPIIFVESDYPAGGGGCGCNKEELRAGSDASTTDDGSVRK
jgi:hypothetical protein